MKLKAIAFITFITMLLVSGTACQNSKETKQPEQTGQKLSMEYEEIIITGAASSGYDSTAKTSGAQYYFSYGTEEEKTKLAKSVETLLAVAAEQYNHTPSRGIEVYFTRNGSAASLKVSRNQVIINLDDQTQLGTFFQIISEGKLPAWLCAGLELYWLDVYGYERFAIDKHEDVSAWVNGTEAKGMPKFGDEWFVTGFAGEGLYESFPSITYAFVKYLQESGQLSELVKAYLYDGEINLAKAEPAEEFRAAAWEAFTGQKQAAANTLFFRYLYGSNIFTAENTLFAVYGTQGHYYYVGTDWQYDTVIEKSRFIESGIKYVKDWFGYEYDKPMPVFLTVEENVGNPVRGGVMRLFNAKNFETRYGFCLYQCNSCTILTALHEAVHALTFNMNEHTSGFISGGRPFLEEGLCDVVMYQYAIDNEMSLADFADTFSVFANGYLADMVNEKLIVYEEITGRSYTDVPSDFRAYSDASAIHKMNVYFSYYGSNNGYDKDSIEFMNDYDTAASFILYLLDKGTKDDFRKIYSKMSLMEEVYGQDLYGMIAEWLLYLGFDEQK